MSERGPDSSDSGQSPSGERLTGQMELDEDGASAVTRDLQRWLG